MLYQEYYITRIEQRKYYTTFLTNYVTKKSVRWDRVWNPFGSQGWLHDPKR